MNSFNGIKNTSPQTVDLTKQTGNAKLELEPPTVGSLDRFINNNSFSQKDALQFLEKTLPVEKAMLPRSKEKNISLDSDDSRRTQEILAFIDNYAATFVDVVRGRKPIDRMMDFIGIPFAMVGSGFQVVLNDKDAILGENALGREIGRLREADFSKSTMDECQIKLTSSDTVLVDILWSRYDKTDKLMATIGATYHVTMTADGWRITTVESKHS